MKKRKYSYLSYKEIEKVTKGENEAMTTMINLYMPYIKVLSHGNMDIEDRVIAKLMQAALQFRIDYER